MAKVLYPGSFDPIHLGHVDVIEQAARLFGHVVIAILHNPEKHGGVFTVEQRIHLVNGALADGPCAGKYSVRAHPGLAVDAAKAEGVDFIVKGLRSASDFDVEQQMAHTNHSVSGVRTVFLPARPDLVFISSRFIREIAQYGGNVEHLVPAPVARTITSIFGGRS